MFLILFFRKTNFSEPSAKRSKLNETLWENNTNNFSADHHHKGHIFARWKGKKGLHILDVVALLSSKQFFETKILESKFLMVIF